MSNITYTEDDLQKAWRTGFEAGVGYTFGHISQDKLNELELERFISWIELKMPWLSWEEWSVLIRKNYVRMTQQHYESCKRTYAESRELFKDNPGMLRYLAENEDKMDKDWEKIKATGTYE